MPVFWRHTYHMVWATHKRAPLIGKAIEAQLHRFLADKAADLECEVYAVNGMADHVHMVLSIPPHRSVSDVVQKLKGASSHHMNTFLAPADGHFAWQRGFGSLTVGERQRSVAVAYVQNQKEHHGAVSTNAWLEECGEAEEARPGGSATNGAPKPE